ncbi:MAG: hypothetical protein Q4F65_09760 [Propionibacteriaceae bacterium]|nr:hypothetical protein [Propionibacteriaceae bacterium]
MSTRWHAALAYALVGEELDLGVQETPDIATLVADLDAAGWVPDRVGEHARAQALWPHPIPDAVRAGLGAAQLQAALGRARAALGLEVLTVLPPSRRSRLDADERRLLADVPPHFGRT